VLEIAESKGENVRDAAGSATMLIDGLKDNNAPWGPIQSAQRV
jgi:hypothetical protein